MHGQTTHFCRIIERAGLKPWPKLWQNLRSTRQTELAEEFPSHVVCAWMGNSRDVAREHYLQVTDEHFERAAQNAAHPAATASVREEPPKPKAPVLSDTGALGAVVSACSLGGTGLEPVTPWV